MPVPVLRPQPMASVTSMADKVHYARTLAEAHLLPSQYRRQPGNLLYAMEYAELLGLHPMAAITGIHVIDGKPSASAALISALVRNAGHNLRVWGDDQSGHAQIVRADDPDFTFTALWTPERGRRAGLCTIVDGRPRARDKNGKPLPWEKYTAALLKARAITEVARDACEDALYGVRYTPEELGAEVDAFGNVTTIPEMAAQSAEYEVVDADIVESPVIDLDALRGAAATAQDAEEVRGLWREAHAHGAPQSLLDELADIGQTMPGAA
ncbi:hypothetical protein [Streptomyces sp. NPDC087300]|uniref:hypothetical protein n=1 Tax=Streptomyces sp. NPDC087300 TaxID=3365780 RepID=UPI00381A321C